MFTIILIINVILLFILLVLIIIKTAHFIKNIRRRKFSNWIYFGHNQLVRSHSSKSLEVKQKQNAYSVSIAMVLLLIFSVVAFEYVVLIQPLPNTAQPNAPKQPAPQPRRAND